MYYSKRQECQNVEVKLRDAESKVQTLQAEHEQDQKVKALLPKIEAPAAPKPRVNTRKYAIIAVAGPELNVTKKKIKDYLNFMFYLPLTAQTWIRIDYIPVIVLVGNEEYWKTDPLLRIIKNECTRVGAHVIVMDGIMDYKIFMAQISRTLASAMPFFERIDSHSYIITTDADIWPIHKTRFDPPCIDCNDHVVVYNYGCCGTIDTHTNIPHYPLSYIGMTSSTWRKVMEIGTSTITNTYDIYKYFKNNKISPTGPDGHRGMEQWFADQKWVSNKIHNFLAKQDEAVFVGVIKNVKAHMRINRSNWNVPSTLDGVLDAHMPQAAHSTYEWNKVLSLIKMLFSEEDVQRAQHYRDSYKDNYQQCLQRVEQRQSQ